MMTEGVQQAYVPRLDSLLRVLWLLLATTIAPGIAMSPAAAQEQKAARTYQFNISAKPLPQAIAELSAVTGVQVLYTEEQAFGKTSQVVLGSYSVEQALGLMLQGTGLTYRFVRPDAVTLERVLSQPEKERLQLEPTTVEGQAIKIEETQVTAEREQERGYAVKNATSATKTDTPIFDLPVSMQVVPREVLDDRQVILFQEALENVSGVIPNYGGADLSDTATVRGFAVRAYRDGVRGRSFGHFTTRTADLERVEVVKGPLSLLYGRIEPGGFFNQVSKEPLATPAYTLQQQFGSFELYRTTLDVTGPVLASPSLLYRLNFEYVDSDSFRQFGKSESIFVAPVLTWNIDGRTWVRFNLRYFDGERNSDRGLIAVDDKVAPIPISRNLGEPWAISDWQDFEAGVTLSHDFSKDWNLRLRFSTEQFDAHFLDVDFFDGLLPDNHTLQRNGFDDIEENATYYTTAELTRKVQTWGISHTILVGGDYYYDEGEFRFTFSDLPSIDIYNPIHGAARPSGPFFLSTSNTEYYGVYFQDQIDLRDNLHLLGGGRYDWATVKSRFDTNPTNRTDDDAFSPRVGLVYQPLLWLALYGSYVESFGADNSGRSRTGQAFEPETGMQYEGGIKAEWWEGALSATLAFYHLTKENVLTPDPEDPNFSVQTGEVRSRGIEFDLAGEMTPGWSIIATYAFTDVRITKDNSGREGFKIEDVPEHSGSLWTRYRFQHGSWQGLSVGAGVYAFGERTGFENDFTVSSYARVDLLAAYTWQLGPTRFTAQLNVENLLDKRYFANVIERAQILPGAPRTFMGLLRVAF